MEIHSLSDWEDLLSICLLGRFTKNPIEKMHYIFFGKIHFASAWEDLLLIQLGRFTFHPTGNICYKSVWEDLLWNGLRRFAINLFGKIHNASDREDASQSIDCIACCSLHSTACFQRVLLTRWFESVGDGLIACDDKQSPKNSHLLVFPSHHLIASEGLHLFLLEDLWEECHLTQ